MWIKRTLILLFFISYPFLKKKKKNIFICTEKGTFFTSERNTEIMKSLHSHSTGNELFLTLHCYMYNLRLRDLGINDKKIYKKNVYDISNKLCFYQL